MTLSKSSSLIVAFWLWLALLPVERSIYLYRSIRDEIVTRRWPTVSRLAYAPIALMSLIAVIAIPSPLAVAVA